MSEKDTSESRKFLLKKIAEKIAKDIDNSCEKKVKEHRFNLAMCNTKETKLNYLNSEKSKLTKFLKESSSNSKRGLNNYLDYLSMDRKDNLLREAAIIFVIRDIFLEAVDKINDLSNAVAGNYTGYNRENENPIKIYIDRASLLEFNYFLTDEINKIKQENSNQLAPNNKLTWHGSKTELVELIKSLIEAGSLKGLETGSIKGTQKDIFKIFENFFGFDLNNFEQTIQKITKRSNGSETLFIDKLKHNFTAFSIKSEQEKRDTTKNRKKKQ